MDHMIKGLMTTIIISSFLVIVFFYPLIPEALRGKIIIGDHGDVYHTVWSIWHTANQLRTIKSPFFTPYLAYPYGTPLTFHAGFWLYGFLYYIFYNFLSPEVFVNLSILSNFLISSVTMYLVIYKITKDNFFSSLVSNAFSFSSYSIARAFAHPDLASIFVFPLNYYAIKFAKGYKRILLISLSLVLSFYIHLYYFIFNFVMLLFLSKTNTQFLKELVIIGILLLVAVCPFLLSFISYYNSFIKTELILSIKRIDNSPEKISPFDYLIPSEISWIGSLSFWKKIRYVKNSSMSPYLSFSLILIAFILFLYKKEKKIRKLDCIRKEVIICLFSFFVSLGPFIHLPATQSRIPNPLLPVFIFIRFLTAPERFSVMVIFFLWVIISKIYKLVEPSKGIKLALTILIILSIVENSPKELKYSSTFSKYNRYFSSIRSENTIVAVVPPFHCENNYLQTKHQKKSIGCCISRDTIQCTKSIDEFLDRCLSGSLCERENIYVVLTEHVYSYDPWQSCYDNIRKSSRVKLVENGTIEIYECK